MDESEITIKTPLLESTVKLHGHTAEVLGELINEVSHLQSELRSARVNRDAADKATGVQLARNDALKSQVLNGQGLLAKRVRESVSVGWAMVIMLAAWSVGMLMGYLPHMK